MSLALALTWILSTTPPARAACTSPTGVAGQFQYNAPAYQLCDGFAWSNLGAASPSGSCALAGELSNSSGPRFCNGSLYTSMAGTETGTTCSTTGLMQYNASLGYMQWCNGTNWTGMRNATNQTAYVQQATLASSTQGKTFTTGSFGGSGNVTTGNALVCMTIYAPTSTVGTVTSMTTGSQALSSALAPFNLAGNANGYYGEIWYAANITGNTATKVTVVLSQTASFVDIICNEYSGIATTNALDQTNFTSSKTATTTANFTTSSSKELIVSFSENDGGTNTVGSGFTQRGAIMDSILTQDKLVTALGSQSAAVGGGSTTTTTTLWYATFRSK